MTCHASTGAASHEFTAAQIATYAEAIHAGGSAPSTTCTVCHTETPLAMINHPNNSSLGTPSCVDCHATHAITSSNLAQAQVPKLGGVMPTPAQACNSCHGGSDGKSAVKPGAHFISASYLAVFAAKIHKNIAPKASMTLSAEDGNPMPAGGQVKIGAHVKLIDTSIDQNENLSSVRVNWGDNTSIAILPGGTASHTYIKAGNKTITLTAIDLKGLKSVFRTKIKVIK